MSNPRRNESLNFLTFPTRTSTGIKVHPTVSAERPPLFRLRLGLDESWIAIHFEHVLDRVRVQIVMTTILSSLEHHQPLTP